MLNFFIIFLFFTGFCSVVDSNNCVRLRNIKTQTKITGLPIL